MRWPVGRYSTEKKGYPTDPKTIGEMIRKRRLVLGLRRIDAAKMISCDEMSIVNWEKGHRSPRVSHMAGVVEFLGFKPFQNGDTLPHGLIGAVAGRQFAKDGEFDLLSGPKRVVLRAQLATERFEDPVVEKMVQWLLASPQNRIVNPEVTITLRELADHEIASGDGTIVQRVRSYDPGHPLIQIALAPFESDEKRAAFLRSYGLDQLPANPEIWARAADMLLGQKEESAAARAIGRLTEMGLPAAGLQKRLEALRRQLHITDTQTPAK